jgi:hypothetical protein
MRSKIWIGVGLAVAAVAQPGLDAAAAKAGARAAWQVADNATVKALPSGQGGEGGEAGAAANLDAKSDAAYAATLAEIKAHVALARELVEDGDTASAKERLNHALTEVYPRAAEAFAARNAGAFEAELKATIVATSTKASAFEAAREALLLKIVAAQPKAQDGAAATRQTLAVLTGLLKAASVEYGEAIEGKTVKEMPEYQFAYAFVRTAEATLAEARPVLAAKDSKALQAVATDLALLRKSLAALKPAKVGMMSPEAFSAAVSRIELKTSRFID